MGQQKRTFRWKPMRRARYAAPKHKAYLSPILGVSRCAACQIRTFNRRYNREIEALRRTRAPVATANAEPARRPSYGPRCAIGKGSPAPKPRFRPIPIRNVSEDLSREAFGLIGFTTRNDCLKSFTSWLYPLP